jgi:acyl carrier protein
MRCFTAVFPQLSPEEIAIARLDTLECWDSVAAATLVTVIEEEFGIELSPEAIETSTSFRSMLNSLSTGPGA